MLAAPAASSAHLLSGSLRAIRDEDRARLERQCQRHRPRDQVQGPSHISRPIRNPPGRRQEHPRILIPAEDLEEFNDNIVGEIEVVATFTLGRS